MKILFVLDQLPYPPRNGITIPTFGYLSRLSHHHQVSLLLIKESGQQLDAMQISKNQEFVNHFWIVERSRIAKISAITDEIFKINPYFLAWNVDKMSLYNCLYGQNFDVVWGSPISVADVVETIRCMLGSNPVFVAGVSDCYTAVLRNMGKYVLMSSIDLRSRLDFTVKWMRSWLIRTIEAKILSNYDIIIVQTDSDMAWLNKISKGKLKERILVLSNGVNENLFQLSLENYSLNILFFANLSGEYGKIFSWIIQKVWPRIRRARESVRFFVVGKDASAAQINMMLNDKSIIYSDYIPDISDVFRGKAALLAPVFKDYGLINKVIESMAAGVPVVGDYGSFNGIPEFRNGIHGIIANGASAMVEETLNILDSCQRHFEIACSARTLILKYFYWEDKVNIIANNLESLIEKKKEIASCKQK